MRPGLTGWAQVKYGYAGSESDALEKLQYEFFYLRHQSLALDLRIIGRTVRAVFGSGGPGDEPSRPSAIVIPVLNEEHHLPACLESIDRQTYPDIVEVFVVDGGSPDDDPIDRRGRIPAVRLIDNPRRIQAAAAEHRPGEAEGDVIVRVDGHCVLAARLRRAGVEALTRHGRGHGRRRDGRPSASRRSQRRSPSR